MSAAHETHVDQTEHAAAPEMADLVQWDSAPTAEQPHAPRGRDHNVGLAVAGVTIAALLVGALVALVISLSG